MSEESHRQEPEFFGTDMNRLDRDWCRQGSDYYEFAIKLVDARDNLNRAEVAFDTAKSDLKEIAAEVRLDVVARPQAHGLEKTTESLIDAAVLVSSRHKDAQAAVHKARRRANECIRLVGELEAACKAMDHKKGGLENLTRLHGQSYFAAPRADAETHRQISDRRIDKALNKRRARDPD